jgi:peptidoglycan/xylan/chitin deacetylase (PgdA/CDA1 family)
MRRTQVPLIVAFAVVFALGALTASLFRQGQPAPPLGVPHVVQAQQQEPVWAWSVERLKQHVEKVRAGKDMTPQSWPDGSRVAVGLSFDTDTEPVWMGALGQFSPAYMARGQYGARAGIDRILALLDKYNIPATFFWQGSTFYLHEDVVKKVMARPQHEIGFHSWVHENPSQLSEAQEREVYQKALDAFKQFTGKTPVGIRTASWDFTDSTLKLIQEFGFLYDSSLMADDRPYMLRANGQETQVLELPVEWILDDWPVFQLNWAGHHWAIRNGDDVFKLWADEFDVAYEEGTIFILTMHPQVIGHRYRMRMLERLIQHMRSKQGVWFATHEQIARHALEHGGR